MNNKNLVTLKKVVSENNQLRYLFEVGENLKKYIKTDIDYEVKFSINGDALNLDEVPDGIKVIPFVANILPIIWITDASLKIDYLDLDFYECITNVKNGYKKMYPNVDFRGKITVEHLIKSKIKRNGNSALFFSLGVDSWYSYIKHREERPTLITILGADIDIDNENGWNILYKKIKEIAKAEQLNLVDIKSSFRKVTNYVNLDNDYGNVIGDKWWHGIQHGIGIISHAAICNYLLGIDKQYFAASFSPDFTPTCASSPIIDNYIRFFNCEVIHDGYIQRNRKIRALVEHHKKTGEKINLHVCWKEESGDNCCRCEKCLRTIMGIRIEGGNPIDYGFRVTYNTYNDMKLFCSYYDFPESVFEKHYWHELQDRFDDNRFMLSKEQNYADISWLSNCDFNDSPALRDDKRYLFPFGIVAEGSRVVIYGAGKVGRAYVRQLISCNYIKELLWVDKNAGALKKSLPMLKGIDHIKAFDADYVVVAISNKVVVDNVVQDLYDMGVEKHKIIWNNPIEMTSKSAFSCIDILSGFNGNSINDSKQKILLINTPEHGNLGDHAIALCEKKFLENYFTEYLLVEITGNQWDRYSSLINDLNGIKAVFITGGGNAGDIWKNEDRRIKEVLSSFSKVPVIMFPNTFYWKGEDNCINDTIFYLSHKNAIYFHREKNSYKNFIEKATETKSYLAPDMVFYCSPVDICHKIDIRNGVAFCLREDTESIINYQEMVNIEQKLVERGITCNHITTVLSHSISINERYDEIKKVLNKIMEHQILITDRLHAMLFAYHTKTPCLVMDSATGKTRGVYEWIKGCPWIKLIDSTDVTLDGIIKMSGIDTTELKTVFNPNELFDEMARTIKECIYAYE